ncbi:MAG: N-6 DNA methylase [Myxococcota bacterium]
MNADWGQHFTPPEVARWLVEQALEGWQRPRKGGAPLRVLDPACGPGALLEAVADVMGDEATERWGVEIDPALVMHAQARLGSAVTVLEADALALAASGGGSGGLLSDGSVDLVVMNPPYIGEKGHRALFRSVAGLGLRWAERTAPRMDYLYYFVHLGLDLLSPGGRLMALTTAYWPSATSGRVLRRDLARRGWVVRWVRFEGARLFKGAPGQHNLAVVVERCGLEEETKPTSYGWLGVRWADERLTVVRREEGLEPLSADGTPWQPFVARAGQVLARRRAQEWTRLGDLVHDRQGVVSGCDRVTARHRRQGVVGLPEGAPVFMWRASEVVARGWDGVEAIRRLFWPLLRGSAIARLDHRAQQRLWADDPEQWVLLYLGRGASPPPGPVWEHLEGVRAVLERRREVRNGIMAWWELHWPRRPLEMRQPKLVTARRADGLRFCLDRAGHAVSSDCTFLVPRAGMTADQLELVWRTLHMPEVREQLEATGKRKGSLFELYSEPLRQLAVPLRWTPEGELISLLPDRLPAVADCDGLP